MSEKPKTKPPHPPGPPTRRGRSGACTPSRAEGYAEGREKGYNEGWRKGHDEGREQGRVRIVEALAGRLLASRGISRASPRLDPSDLRGVADEEVVDALLRSEDGADFQAWLARLRKAPRAGETDGP